MPNNIRRSSTPTTPLHTQRTDAQVPPYATPMREQPTQRPRRSGLLGLLGLRRSRASGTADNPAASPTRPAIGVSGRRTAPNSPLHAQGGEQPSGSGAAPRIAAPVLRRSSAIPRDRAEGLMAQGEPSRAEAQNRTTGGSSPRPSTPSVASPAGAARRASAPDVNGIIEQFRNAGVDLADAHRTLSDVMNGNAVRIDGHTMGVLRQHFPHMLMNGISDGDPLAVALHQALGRFARPSAPLATFAPSPARAQAQPRVTGGLPQRRPAPSRGAGTSAPTRQRQAHRANARPSSALLEPLTRSGIDMNRLRSALDNMLLFAADFPADIRRALNQAGIDTHIEENITLVDHPLLQLRQEIRRAESTRNNAGGATPTRDAQRPDRIRQAAPSRALAMPARGPAENNGQFAWRVYTQNPGVSVEDVASAVVRSGGNRQATVDALKAHIKTYEKICAAFSELRPISKADAEGMGFKDAAVYNQEGDGPFSKDLATTCLFGEELSVRNRNQQVIGLAQVASDPKQGYRADVNKDVVFMDMKKLAEYLVSNPKHPMNNMPLTADNIHNFAFRIA